MFTTFIGHWEWKNKVSLEKIGNKKKNVKVTKREFDILKQTFRVFDINSWLILN